MSIVLEIPSSISAWFNVLTHPEVVYHLADSLVLWGDFL